MDVTLIVKASNQQCEDLTIKCEPSWTIRRLKGHLTEVYPGKPNSDEQKLIYSGQLLGDSVVLKDVLRQYDGQQAHTVHLVFTPKNHCYSSSSNIASKAPATKMAANQNPSASCSSSTANVGATSARGVSEDSGSLASQERESAGSSIDNGGLRQRMTRPTLRTLPGTSALMEETAALHSFVQHTYMQYLNQYINLINSGQSNVNAYAPSGVPLANASLETSTATIATAPAVVPALSQPVAPGPFTNFPSVYYPCMMPAGALPSGSSIPAAMSAAGTQPVVAASSFLTPSIPNPAPSSSSLGSPTAATTNQQVSLTSSTSSSPSGVSPTAPAADEAPTVATTPAQQVPAQDQGVADAPDAAAARGQRRFPNIVVEEQENNDWLDVFFSMCRVGILMTVIYVYSSPMRCFTVLMIGVMLYLKKHLDRLSQAVDRRGADAPQPAAAGDQQNNNVPGGAPQEQRIEQTTAEEQPVVDNSSDSLTAESLEQSSNVREDDVSASNIAATSSTSNNGSRSPSIMPRPRTGPAAANSRATEGSAAAQQAAPVGSELANLEQPATEGQRMTLNDMTSFLGTLVITFFTSIIPDTPAA
ncbi:homocysteine-responsive endoplasmic reticulum-resident ubiquitin-like domain member 1 protein [Anopheles bellator]|uniref:homocysteine-responsive endoplasmic reticulum-resident ubiquitin-like domain member 1 protein n=1 Tax=Anopheles bellator TaxID=139047 RepID=UPI00264A40F2|nr:homocysteine-responsive endoplasmic reticulum-resident ubiquitin-like domain member 1 protein [Anopheles bellator]